MKTKSKKKKPSYFSTVPPQEILPIVDGRYESSVKGLFVIGDVTGLPLVKVAANQGRTVIEKMEESGLFSPEQQEGLDLIIVGGGPAGISAAIECEKRRLKYVLLERSQLANTVRTFPSGKKVYAEPQTIKNISELDVDRDLDRDDFLSIVEETVAKNKLKYKEGIEVATIRKLADRQFEVHTKDGNVFPSRQVLVAIGRQGQPRKLKIDGCDDCKKVTYRLHTREDYNNEDVLVVGGGNSAIEAALMLKDHNRVTLSYRGDDFFRAKEENRRLLDQAIADGEITALMKSNITHSRDGEVDLDVAGVSQTLKNDKVIILIGTLPPIEFLMETGMELDGVWTSRRVIWSIVGILVGIFLYFGAKNFVLHPEDAGGKYLWPSWASFLNPNSAFISFITMKLAPLVAALVVGARVVQYLMSGAGKKPAFQVPATKLILTVCLALFVVGMISPGAITSDVAEQGSGPYFLDLSLKSVGSEAGVASVFDSLSPGFKNGDTGRQGRGARYFSNLSGVYYLLYFGLIGVFGIYWAFKTNSKIIWKRNLTIIACQWTLWWGIPTFLVALFGRSAIAPVLKKSLNAWPLNMSAFKVNPVAGPGDPEWWHMVGIVGVVWAVVLTFIIIPLFTIRYGKIYCSYICSCGALAETVGNSFRHRGPKGDWPRRLEKYGYIFILLATIATIADLMGWAPVLWMKGSAAYGLGLLGFGEKTGEPFRLNLLGWYDIWVGTFLAGAMAIGLYPFLGQRIWCRMWCPLAFWMNFWGRWSTFKITPEKGKCIDCNVCNQFCQMGIDIKGRALRGEPVTLVDTPCVGCQECIVRCPMQILHLGDAPQSKLVQLNGAAKAAVTTGSNA